MKTVFVVGAGPAGMFAAQRIAQAGHQVVILNRDIKPGGLAEYGIYPTKDKMKVGLRKQFAKVLTLPNVHYLGHVCVASTGCLSIDELRQFNPSAIVFAVGAQGTKKLELEGSSARGVYSAKDFVYFYNQLPPYTSQDFSAGKRVAVIGMGNVAIDIAHWFLVDAAEKPEEVTIIARRGPFEAKFDKKEFAFVEQYLDREAFQVELKRIQRWLEAVGQEISKVAEQTFPILAKPQAERPGPGRLLFRFLSTPCAIHTDSAGRISRLQVNENVLTQRQDGIGCKATEQTADLDVDTMIFAIGDVADPAVGLPYGSDSYLINSDPADPQRAAYEIYDQAGCCAMEGIYVVGWARKASEGLVGIARHDAEVGATHVLKYLEGVPEKESATLDEIKKSIESRGVRTVDKADLELLAKAEEEQARAKGMTWFKFSDDEAMLLAIDEKKKSSAEPVVSGRAFA
jgi:ferredoxin/flavodoxin---NADP+ reductase